MDILLGLALSHHLNFQNNYNEIHPHVRLQQDYFIAGAYYNSEERISPYAGIRLGLDSHGVEVGAAGGYPQLGIAVPYIRYTYDVTNNLRFFVTPGGEVVDDETQYGIVVGVELLAF